MENNQNNILRAIYWKSKEVTVDEIMKDTSLKREQIHRAVTRLEDRGFITKRTDQPGWTDGKWHSRKSHIKIKNVKFTEEYLIKKGLI